MNSWNKIPYIPLKIGLKTLPWLSIANRLPRGTWSCIIWPWQPTDLSFFYFLRHTGFPLLPWTCWNSSGLQGFALAGSSSFPRSLIGSGFLDEHMWAQMPFPQRGFLWPPLLELYLSFSYSQSYQPLLNFHIAHHTSHTFHSICLCLSYFFVYCLSCPPDCKLRLCQVPFLWFGLLLLFTAVSI